ncbi:FlgO family outer membrane protein [Marinobacterium arenosum]|uniref:FlgO family outer membrane protein n=1 Tax=Marinobacterium arenosum TaxID=2862496 RepID=UPI001C98A8D7|nr:FlgO family outer membrane protein [Marinobacterium arenosum]MBY4675639.1 hypothetical protein [Marinobacterium arenosum]
MRLILLPLLGLLLVGCGVERGLLSPAEPEPVAPVTEPVEPPEPVIGEVIGLPDGSPTLDPVSQAVRQMGEQLMLGLHENRVKRMPMAILPFVERPAVASDNRFGERISEAFIFQLQQRGYNLVDYRAVSMITTAKPALDAQQLSGLRNRFRIYFVLTGTYVRYPDGIVVNARVLDTTTRQVLATGQTHIANDRLEGALPGYDPLTAQRRGMIVENSDGPTGH